MSPKKSRMSIEEQKIALLEAGETLGYEVGLKGHLDNVGKIVEKKRALLKKARDLGVLEKMMFKYAVAKETGTKERRFSIYSKTKPGVTVQPRRTERSKVAERPVVEPGPRGLHFEDEERVTTAATRPERIGISPRAIINLIEAIDADSTAKYQRFYEVLMNVADVSDEVPYIHGKETLEKVLSALKRNGWISDYAIEIFSPARNDLYILLGSTYAKYHERSRRPVCRILTQAIERAASSAFGREVRVVETKCMAQGFNKCEFSTF